MANTHGDIFVRFYNQNPGLVGTIYAFGPDGVVGPTAVTAATMASLSLAALANLAIV